MKSQLTLLCLMGLLGVGGMPAQERSSREIEQRLRELQEEIRALERQLAERRGRNVFVESRILSFAQNRARLGVLVQTRADEETDVVGALLESVDPDGPAQEAGLESGDIITSFNGEPLTGRYPPARPDESEPARKLIDLVGELQPGDTVAIEYRRGNQTLSTVATLDDRRMNWAYTSVNDDPLRVVLSPSRGVDVRRLGDDIGFVTVFGGPWSEMELVSMNEDLGRYFGTNEGLLVIRPPDEPEIDLQSGDVILSIGGREPVSASRALRILRSYAEGETVEIAVMRDRNRITVSAVVPDRRFGRRDFRYNWYD